MNSTRFPLWTFKLWFSGELLTEQKFCNYLYLRVIFAEVNTIRSVPKAWYLSEANVWSECPRRFSADPCRKHIYLNKWWYGCYSETVSNSKWFLYWGRIYILDWLRAAWHCCAHGRHWDYMNECLQINGNKASLGIESLPCNYSLIR